MRRARLSLREFFLRPLPLSAAKSPAERTTTRQFQDRQNTSSPQPISPIDDDNPLNASKQSECVTRLIPDYGAGHANVPLASAFAAGDDDSSDCDVQATDSVPPLWAFRSQSDTTRPGSRITRSPLAETQIPAERPTASSDIRRDLNVANRPSAQPRVSTDSSSRPATESGSLHSHGEDHDSRANVSNLAVPFAENLHGQGSGDRFERTTSAPKLKEIKSRSGLKDSSAVNRREGPAATCLTDFLSRFEQGPVLGEGTSGIVYTLRETSTAKQYACKIINFEPGATDEASSPEASEAPAAPDRCVREDARLELRLLKMLRHPNLVALHDFYIDDRHCAMIVDLLQGGDLFRYLKRRRAISEPEAKPMVRGVLRCLAYLHAQGIAHRDIKLENILLESDSDVSNVKVVDLGMAKFLRQTDGGPARRLHTICGTPLYIAPEILSCMGKVDGKMRSQYSTQVDIWACGIVMYMVLSGKEPYSTKAHLSEVLRQIHAGYLDFLPPLLAIVSSDAGNFLQKLLTVDPACRITAEEALSHPWLRTD